jgi:hypothetical protein
MTEEEAMRCIGPSEAKSLGLKHYFTGKPCSKGHLSQRLTSTRACCECFKAYYEQNLHSLALYKKQYKQKHAEKFKELDKAYYEENKSDRRKKMKEYAANNMPKILEIQAKRRAAKVLRVPSWLSKQHRDQIVSIYENAKQLRDSTGIDHHVDHIVPLQGKTVSGLHVPWNLQVISAKENFEKKNYWWPDMWSKGLI